MRSSSCSSKQRIFTCKDGTWKDGASNADLATYSYASCDGSKSCTVHGITYSHGTTLTTYSQNSSSSCSSYKRISKCSDGFWDYAPYSYTSCSAPSGGGGGCFLSGTKVLTDKGTKNIEDIEVGDIVLSYKAKQDKFEYRPVTKLFVHEDINEDLYELTINGKILKVTELHRFYVLRENRKPYQCALWYEWIAASRLKVGDTLMMSNGTYVKIDAINHYPIRKTVYNLEVEEHHNYFVEDGYLVHNAVSLHNMNTYSKTIAGDKIYDVGGAGECTLLVDDLQSPTGKRCGDSVYLY